MAVVKIKSGNDIVNGAATVCNGQTTSSYDPLDRDVHFTSTSGVAIFIELQTRYLYHGGPGGSGNWEH